MSHPFYHHDPQIRHVLSCFDGVKPTGNERWAMFCPSHEDRTRSLFARNLGDKLVFNCKAGCQNEDIFKAAGVHPRELFLNNHSGGPQFAKQRREQDTEDRREAAGKTITVWNAAKPARPDHPYLIRKGVSPVSTLREIDCQRLVSLIRYSPKAIDQETGQREQLEGRVLIAPLKIDNALCSFEMIDEQGRKTALAHGAKKGAYWASKALPQNDGTGAVILIGEGVATVLSAFEAVGVFAVAVFGCNNFLPAGRNVKERWPRTRLVVLADKGNGQQAAVDAAEALGACVAIPTGAGVTDFNDMAAEHGLAAVREAIEAAISGNVKSYKKNASHTPHSPHSRPVSEYGLHRSSENTPHTPQNPSRMEAGSLVIFDDKKKPSRLIESQAAEIVADGLRNVVAWDSQAGAWLIWRPSTHWEPLTNPAEAERIVADAVHVGLGDVGFRVHYLNGVTTILQRRNLLERPPRPTGLVPFANGLLSVAENTLIAATPDRALDWYLPHNYDRQAECPRILAWLHDAVDGDSETVDLLLALIAALIRQIPLQKIFVLIGPGGSGKSTFINLLIALAGTMNVAVSTLSSLETNRFETAKLFGKPLLVINEAGRHKGELNMLKAITGGDLIPLERKHIQQSGSFVFNGLVVLATNEDIQAGDNTSGIERRRVTVRFDKLVSAKERADWEAQGGPEAILHREIPGLIRLCLELSSEEILARFERLSERVRMDNLLGMQAGNSVADWLVSNCVPEAGVWTQIGLKKEFRDNGKVLYEGATVRLYPNYLTWCQEAGRSRPVSGRKFRSIAVDIARKLGADVSGSDQRQPGLNVAKINGIRLRGEYEEHFNWAKL